MNIKNERIDIWMKELGRDSDWVFGRQLFHHSNGYVMLWQEKMHDGSFKEFVRVRNTETGETHTWEEAVGQGYKQVFIAAACLRMARTDYTVQEHEMTPMEDFKF